MTIDELLTDLKAKYPRKASEIDSWRTQYEAAFGVGGPNLTAAYAACMAKWKGSGFPKASDIARCFVGRKLTTTSDNRLISYRMNGFCLHDELVEWQRQGLISRRSMIAHAGFDPDRFFGKPKSARELRMNWEEIPFTHLSDAEAEKCLPYYEQTLADNYTDVAAGILRIMIGNRAKNMRGVPA